MDRGKKSSVAASKKVITGASTAKPDLLSVAPVVVAPKPKNTLAKKSKATPSEVVVVAAKPTPLKVTLPPNDDAAVNAQTLTEGVKTRRIKTMAKSKSTRRKATKEPSTSTSESIEVNPKPMNETTSDQDKLTSEATRFDDIEGLFADDVVVSGKQKETQEYIKLTRKVMMAKKKSPVEVQTLLRMMMIALKFLHKRMQNMLETKM